MIADKDIITLLDLSQVSGEQNGIMETWVDFGLFRRHLCKLLAETTIMVLEEYCSGTGKTHEYAYWNLEAAQLAMLTRLQLALEDATVRNNDNDLIIGTNGQWAELGRWSWGIRTVEVAAKP